MWHACAVIGPIKDSQDTAAPPLTVDAQPNLLPLAPSCLAGRHVLLGHIRPDRGHPARRSGPGGLAAQQGRAPHAGLALHRLHPAAGRAGAVGPSPQPGPKPLAPGAPDPQPGLRRGGLHRQRSELRRSHRPNPTSCSEGLSRRALRGQLRRGRFQEVGGTTKGREEEQSSALASPQRFPPGCRGTSRSGQESFLPGFDRG